MGGKKWRAGARAAISLKRVKIEEKLQWRAYRKSQTLFRTVPSPTPYGLPKIGGSHPPKLQSLLSQERVKLATNCKFCTHMIDRNKSPLKRSGKVAQGVLRDSRKFSGYRI